MEIIIIGLIVLVVAAYFVTEDKFIQTSPALVIKQVAYWLSFGMLFTIDVSKLTVKAAKNANVSAALANEEAGIATDIGAKEGKEAYQNSEIKKSIDTASTTLGVDTRQKLKRIQELRAAKAKAEAEAKAKKEAEAKANAK